MNVISPFLSNLISWYLEELLNVAFIVMIIEITKWTPNLLSIEKSHCFGMNTLRRLKGHVKTDTKHCNVLWRQISLFLSSVVGPATIFLMVSGAMALAWKISLIPATLITMIPIVLFLVVALTTKQSTQVNSVSMPTNYCVRFITW